MNRRTLIILAAVFAVVALIGAVYIGYQMIQFANTSPTTVGTPQLTSQFKDLIETKVKSPTPAPGAQKPVTDGISLISYSDNPAPMDTMFQQLYTSCLEMQGSTATLTMSGDVPPTATTEPTTVPTVESAAAAEPDYIVLQVVGEESEACYQVGEVFFDRGNRFNLAVGVTKAINGEVAVDRANIANSLIGEIVIDISQFESDSRMRDGAIRRQWLSTNQYPLARLTNARAVGLPARPYVDGEVLEFQIIGDLNVREVTREVTFRVKAALTGNTLVVTAETDFLMSDFGAPVPDIAGMLKANDETHIILNLVLREPAA
jgi:polyisoprenoid-binding protein YceI